nr:MAG TPA: hypothetical protein [Caudoviricetes sp.]
MLETPYYTAVYHPVSVIFLYPGFMLWWLRLREC